MVEMRSGGCGTYSYQVVGAVIAGPSRRNSLESVAASYLEYGLSDKTAATQQWSIPEPV